VNAASRASAVLAPAPAEAGHVEGTTPALRRTLLRSLSWIGVARAVSGLGALARYVIFAQLLAPFDFGVVAAASFFEVLFQSIANPNFERALVAEPEAVEPYLDTVWLAMLVRGAMVAAALALLARPLASVFNIEASHQVFLIVAPMALLIALKSPGSTGRIYRGLDFQVSLVLNFAEMVASLAGGLAGIWYWHDWRGLVAAMYAGHLVRTGLSYWYYPYRPRLHFDRARARRMFMYGRWITARSVVEFAARNLDSLAVGHLLGPGALGEYQMAFRAGELPPVEVASGLGMVSFPIVARVAASREATNRLFMLAAGAVVVFGICYATLIWRFGPALIAATLGWRWLGALAPLRLLCLYGLLQGLINLGSDFLDGLNAPGSSLQLTLIGAATLAILVYPLTISLGASGAALAIAISAAAPVPRMLSLYTRANQAGA
jgi:lipopolysaccharide exporter